MREVYYNRTRIAAVAISLLVLFIFSTISVTARQDPLKTAASLESHEGLSISALPWTDASKYKEKFSKKSPYAAGVLAIQVSFRNDSEDSMKVGLSRIRLTLHLDSENVQELPPLTPIELADTVLKPGAKDPTRRRVPLPVPLPSGGGKDNKASELQKEAQNASVPTNVIAPHSTVQGLLYFDLQGQFDLLETAHLYVPDVMLMHGNRGLTYFDIDLSRQTTP